MDPVSSSATIEASKGIAVKKYSRYLSSLRSSSSAGGGDGDLDTLLNGVIKKKLKIIPDNVTSVYSTLFLFFLGTHFSFQSSKNLYLYLKMMHILCVYRWGGQSDYVFTAMTGDFMKPRINEVMILPLQKSKIIVHRLIL